jgi:hypothetical protein
VLGGWECYHVEPEFLHCTDCEEVIVDVQRLRLPLVSGEFLSLRILPPDCNLGGLKNGVCPLIDEKQASLVNLNIENVFTPQSILDSAIGFETLPPGFMYTFPAGVVDTIPAQGFTLTGTININLTNVFVELAPELWVPLLGFDAFSVGKVVTNGQNVNVNYGLKIP